MNPEAEKEEKLRESACIGDLDQLRKLIESDHANVNAQNNMNGWTALHWACKRNHSNVVKYLLDRGADKSLQNSSKELAAQLTNTAEIRQILEYSGNNAEITNLPITPSYLKYPVFPYTAANGETPVAQDVPVTTPRYQPSVNNNATAIACNEITDPNELVLKARIAYSLERDFIEVELDRKRQTFESLTLLLTQELHVDRQHIHKIRKLPNTIVRKDKDVSRLTDYQELEVVLTNKAMSAGSRTYDESLNDGFKHEHILY